jgi:hypothetical protein
VVKRVRGLGREIDKINPPPLLLEPVAKQLVADAQVTPLRAMEPAGTLWVPQVMPPSLEPTIDPLPTASQVNPEQVTVLR